MLWLWLRNYFRVFWGVFGVFSGFDSGFLGVHSRGFLKNHCQVVVQNMGGEGKGWEGWRGGDGSTHLPSCKVGKESPKESGADPAPIQHGCLKTCKKRLTQYQQPHQITHFLNTISSACRTTSACLLRFPLFFFWRSAYHDACVVSDILGCKGHAVELHHVHHLDKARGGHKDNVSQGLWEGRREAKCLLKGIGRWVYQRAEHAIKGATAGLESPEHKLWRYRIVRNTVQ